MPIDITSHYRQITGSDIWGYRRAEKKVERQAVVIKNHSFWKRIRRAQLDESPIGR